MNEEWCREKLEKLQIIETRTDTLNEIKSQIVREPINQIVLNFIQSPELLDCCNSSTSSTEQTNLACDILSICMSNINLEQSQTAQSVLERALNNANPKVQSIGIKELSRILDLAGADASIVDESLINSLFKCLQSSDTKVGTPTIEILVKILPNVIDMNVVRENVEKTFSCDDVVRCRTYEVAIKLAQQSPVLHAKLEYVLDRVIIDLDNPDILVQMNVLALLADLPLKQHGLVYLENKNIFNILLKKIDSIDSDSYNGLMAPGLIRFFGSVASKHPEKVFNGYPNVITLLFECLNSEDRTVLPTAFDTLGE
jgi:26S proteasome non-ATPase regulatory subunit 5